MPLKVAFFGSGEFAVPTLERLLSRSSHHELVAVVSRPPRPAGRGKKLRPTPVDARARTVPVPCRTPESANSPEFLEELAGLEADLFVVADYGELLRKSFRDLPRIGVYNLHGSLLPRYRGAAPVVQALLEGETTTGVTLFRIEKGLDSGPIVDTKALDIRPDETAGELEERLAHVAADLLESSLQGFETGTFRETPQDATAATWAPKVHKNAARLDWNQGSSQIINAIRAYNPWPGAYSFLQREDKAPERTVFLRARAVERSPAPQEAAPGTIILVEKQSFQIACGGGAIEVEELQRAGKAPLNATQYLRGRALVSGDRFGDSASSDPE
jgi:methionyl-tRNA formyltransferase